MSCSIGDAFTAASYPLLGIWTVLRNVEYWTLFSRYLSPLFLIAAIMHLYLFLFWLVPQFNFLVHYLHHGSTAWPNAIVLTCAEGLALVPLLKGGYNIDLCRSDAFDATLVKLHHGQLVTSRRVVHQDAPDAVQALGRMTGSIPAQPWELFQLYEAVWFLGRASIRYFGFQIAVYLPLILIPYVGGPLFVVVAGRAMSRFLHSRWLQLRGFSDSDKQMQLDSLWWQDVWFGSVALSLELVPFLSPAFLVTNNVASAMWAADIENKRNPSLKRPGI